MSATTMAIITIISSKSISSILALNLQKVNMAISYSTNNAPPTLKPFSVLLSVFMIFFLMLLGSNKVNSQSVSFNYPRFNTTSNSNLLLQGTTRLSGSVLALINRASPQSNTGRVLHQRIIPLWNINTGRVATFTTSFTFVARDWFLPRSDGFMFFIAPTTASAIPPNSGGGYLGVVNGNSAINQFVGVEFDSFSNPWDPSYPHVGINVNSLISLRTSRWAMASGSLIDVTVRYDSNQVLHVTWSKRNVRPPHTMSQAIDLKAVLPSTVRIGFSATSGNGAQDFDLHSWQFSSTLATTTTTTDGSSIIDEEEKNGYYYSE